MTFWRQKTVSKKEASKSDFFDVFEADPFNFNDELSLEEVLTPAKSFRSKKDHTLKAEHNFSEIKSSKLIPRSKHVPFRYLAGMVVVAALSVFLVVTRPWTYWGATEAVYAYFEVRAVDHSGRPVAGAIVKNAGKKVGTTDSFGEWRRYMRVPLGATVPITIEKKTSSENQFAIKNFAVPPTKPEKSDLELRASIQLLAEGGKEKIIAASAAAASTQETTNTPTSAEAATLEPLKATETVAEKSEKEPVASSFASSHESLWIEAMGSQNSPLSREILPAMVRRAQELGLKIDPSATWKVRLSGLLEKPTSVGKDGGGLILISSFDGESSTPHEFLRNYQSDSRLTARGILYVLSKHINKNVALFKTGSTWVAGLPKSSSAFWKLAPDMSLVNGKDGKVEVLTSKDLFENNEFSGYLLKSQNSSDFICSSSNNICEFTTKSFSQFPPVPSWARMKLKISSGEKDMLKVFVSGYEAKHLQNGVFEYWGQDHAKVNVTLVHAGHLVKRVQIQNDMKNPPIVAINGASVSRR